MSRQTTRARKRPPEPAPVSRDWRVLAVACAGVLVAGYLGTGNGRVQFPLGTQHVIREVGTTLILYSWLPAASSDQTAGHVADALNKVGIGFTVPS